MIIKGLKNIKRRLDSEYGRNLSEWYEHNPRIRAQNERNASLERNRKDAERERQRKIEEEQQRQYDLALREDRLPSYCESCVVVGMGFGSSCNGSCFGNEDRL